MRKGEFGKSFVIDWFVDVESICVVYDLYFFVFVGVWKVGDFFVVYCGFCFGVGLVVVFKIVSVGCLGEY